MYEQIDYDEFKRIEMRIGKIISAKPNIKARIPAYILEIDFGTEIGVKISSAQLTEYYIIDSLINRCVACVMNFESKRVAGVKSEVLVLAAISDTIETKLLFVDEPVILGSLIS